MDQSTHENICTMLLNVNLREREVRDHKLRAESLPYPNKMESRNIGMLGSRSNFSVTLTRKINGLGLVKKYIKHHFGVLC